MIRQATAVEALNLALRFILEIATLLALGYWASGLSDSGLLRVVFGVGVPLFAAMVWGAFISPKAIARLDDPLRLFAEMLFFTAGSGALVARISTALGLGFMAIVLINITLLFLLGQRGR